MSLTVTQRPSQTVGSETSTWNAVGNPILYKMQRKDFTFNQVNNNAGDIQLQFNAVNVATSFQVGDTIYIQSDNGVYDLFAVVTASAFSVNTLVTVDAAYISAAPGGFTNNDDLRPAYRVEVELYRSSDDELISDAVLENSPNRYGEVTINVSKILRAYLSPNNDADLTGSTEVFDDTNVYIGFYIKYTEVWLESGESQTDDVANQFFAVLGARQIPSTYGGNMFEYVPFSIVIIINQSTNFNVDWTNQGSGVNWNLTAVDINTTLTTGQTSKRARRLCTIMSGRTYRIRFTLDLYTGGSSSTSQLTIYTGATIVHSDEYPGDFTSNVDVTFTAASNYTYIELEVSAISVDVSPTIDDIVLELTTQSIEAKFLTKFNKPVMWAGYPFLMGIIINEDVPSSVYLTAGSDSTAPTYPSGRLIEFDLNQIVTDQTVEEFSITVYEDDSTDDPQLSEVLEIELREACDNPVMLLARNSLGGPLQWLFDGSQEYTFDYGDGRKAKRLILTANNLTVNQWEALQDFITLGEVYKNNIVEFTSATIKTSTRIGQQVYVVDADGDKIGVVVIPTKNRTETRQIKHQFEIEIEYPEFFTA